MTADAVVPICGAVGIYSTRSLIEHLRDDHGVEPIHDNSDRGAPLSLEEARRLVAQHDRLRRG